MIGQVAIGQVWYQAAPVPVREVSWPVRVGSIPGLASAFQERPGIRERIRQARSGQATGGVVLTQVLAGGGGVGKSQVAASYAGRAVREGVDLVAWVPATDLRTVIATFGQAAVEVGLVAVGGSGDVEADARLFVGWLAGTGKTWLVVLDDVADPEGMNGPEGMGSWWPVSHTQTGWVLATTRRRDALLTGSGRVLVDVDVYSEQESLGYLTDRLTRAGSAALLDEQAGDLTVAVAHLPLALSHAAAYMIDQGMTCARYLHQYRVERRHLDRLMPTHADADAYGRAVSTTWALSIAAADRSHPVGVASRRSGWRRCWTLPVTRTGSGLALL